MRSIRRFLSPTGYSREHPPDSDISSWAFRSRLLNLFFLLFFFCMVLCLAGVPGRGQECKRKALLPAASSSSA